MRIKVLAAVSAMVLVSLFSFNSINKLDNSAVNGAWKIQQGNTERALVLNDGYFMIATFDKSRQHLIATRGGAYKFDNGKLTATIEFNPQNKAEIGETKTYVFDVKGKTLNSDINGTQEAWSFVDDGKGPMVGTWRSSGGMRDGKVVLNPPRARKTFKLVTGSRFQWAAINAETKEFFGTGGGSYTYNNGKYTETLEFFTKDSTKVGNSLTFDAKIEGDLWHHSGLSSQGKPMYEIWKMEPRSAN